MCDLISFDLKAIDLCSPLVCTILTIIERKYIFEFNLKFPSLMYNILDIGIGIGYLILEYIHVYVIHM